MEKVNLEKLEAELRELKEHKGITNIAVLFMHSYLYHEHELQVEKLALKLGFENISLSHKISPMIRSVPRGLTSKTLGLLWAFYAVLYFIFFIQATIDAYLTPCIDVYLKSFKASFSSHVNVLFMQSDGGLTSLEKYIFLI